MKCSRLLFGAISLGVVVLVYLTTSTYCDIHQFEVRVSDVQNNSSNKLIADGLRHENDTVLFNETITRDKSKPLRRVSKKITYPPKKDKGDYIFTYIEVEDIVKGGCINWTNGGPGCAYVNFKLKAKKNEEYKFLITLYGYIFDP